MARFKFLFSTLSMWWLAGSYLFAWMWPQKYDGYLWIQHGTKLLGLEFLTIHSGVFLVVANFFARKASRTIPMWQLATAWFLFYSIAASFIVFSGDSMKLAHGFLMVFVPRLLMLLRGLDDFTAGSLIIQSVVSMFFLICATFAAAFLPLPAWGLNGEILAIEGMSNVDGEVQQRLFIGLTYFFTMGCAYALLVFWQPPKNAIEKLIQQSA